LTFNLRCTVFFVFEDFDKLCFISGLSFNQPKFCPSASWNPNATTFGDINIVGMHPNVIFLNKNNSIYLNEGGLFQVQMWLEGNIIPSRTIPTGLNSSQGLFVTSNGDIYIDNGLSYSGVEKWALNTTSGVVAMNISEMCYNLFVDTNDTLYCSIGNQHKVVKTALNSGGTIPILAAGNGTAGSASNMVANPQGLFVDLSFNLYVAECDNNRVQLLQSGQLNGTTVAGNGATGTITLSCPTGIMLDADGHLFIVEFNGNRIVGSGPNGFRCIAGCWGTGNLSNQLNNPYSFSFDTYGNIFVSDRSNHRVQKFSLAINICGKYPAVS
jgi:hypothetical protein